MKQMINTEAPVAENTLFGHLQTGFFRICNGEGKIFYVITWGNEPVPFPVREDGLISKRSQGIDMLHPYEEIEIIEAKDLGISEIKWTNP